MTDPRDEALALARGALDAAEKFITAETDSREDSCFEKSGYVWVSYVKPAQAARDQMRTALAAIDAAMQAPADVSAVEAMRRIAADAIGTLAETTYDYEPEFGAVMHAEAIVRALPLPSPAPDTRHSVEEIRAEIERCKQEFNECQKKNDWWVKDDEFKMITRIYALRWVINEPAPEQKDQAVADEGVRAAPTVCGGVNEKA